jgi:hypothetical protein
MNRDEILKHLTIEDVPESCELLVEYLNIDAEVLQREAFYMGDNLDVFRYLIKHLEGISFRIPRLKALPSVQLRYITKRILKRPAISVQRLSFETGLDEKTIREYLRNITDHV